MERPRIIFDLPEDIKTKFDNFPAGTRTKILRNLVEAAIKFTSDGNDCAKVGILIGGEIIVSERLV